MSHKAFSFGLIGYPLSHSISPTLHRAALQEVGLSGDYLLYPIPPLPEGEKALVNILLQIREGKLDGMNVTIPHKQSVLPFLDDLSPSAKRIGAVNTVYAADGRLVGENTDTPGFMNDLRSKLESLPPEDRQAFQSTRGNQALVLGAGGAARAVVSGLGQMGWRSILCSRRIAQAQRLVEEFLQAGQDYIAAALPLSNASLKTVLDQISLIVQATPVGMWPDLDSNPWPQNLPFPKACVLYDLVYNPPVTAIMEAARKSGIISFNGLGMLIEQAALSFELWTGQIAPRTKMFAAAVSLMPGYACH
jgi:shikimate dehydrogenase